MKATSAGRRVWVECAVLAGVSALFEVLTNKRFACRKPTEPLPMGHPGDILAVVLEKSTPEGSILRCVTEGDFSKNTFWLRSKTPFVERPVNVT